MATVRRLERAISTLAAEAIERMDETLPWYAAMPPEHRSWVGLVAQAGIAALRRVVPRPRTRSRPSPPTCSAPPRASWPGRSRLQQTVELVRVDDRRRRGAASTELAAAGDEADAPRGGAALLPRDRLRGRPGLRPGGRGPRRLGRAARGARRRRAAARRGRTSRALPGGRARLGSAGERRSSSWSVRARDAAPTPWPRASSGRPARPALDVISGVQGDRLVVAIDGVREPRRGRAPPGTSRAVRPRPGRGRPGRRRPHRGRSVRRRGRGRPAGRGAWPDAPRPVRGRRPAARAGARRRPAGPGRLVARRLPPARAPPAATCSRR